jgi:sialate O-acetylesterase
LFEKVKKEKNSLVDSFEKASIKYGLSANAISLISFEIAGANKAFKAANATIKLNKVVVENAEIKVPVYLRYAKINGILASLFNKARLS